MKTKAILSAFAMLFISFALSAQSLNGQKFSFPNGTKEWSEPIIKNLQSVKMEKSGVAPVELSFRVKLQKKVAAGKWYYVEITNKSEITKIKFDLSAGFGQDVYTIKLKPGETKNFEKFNWHLMSFADKCLPDDQVESWAFDFKEISAN